MKFIKSYIKKMSGHRVALLATLCLFAACMLATQTHNKRRTIDDKVYLVHADQLKFDMYGDNPEAQILKGKVLFKHQGTRLWCDSAYYYQESNSFKAFGHVRMKQGDTLSLTCKRAFYDGQNHMLEARENVILKHRRQTLYTDSLNFDRLYKNIYFFEGGRLIDGKDKLVADWGEYSTETRLAHFCYNVKMKNAKRTITTDTLYYDVPKSVAHVIGKSKIISQGSIIHTNNAYFNTKTDQSKMYGRSTVADKQKTITADTLLYNKKTGQARGMGKVIFVDKKNKTKLTCGIVKYNEKTGRGYATQKAVVEDFSHKDTLYMHADSIKVFTYHINTDSAYRKINCFDKVRVYRKDIQAVCDSMTFNSKDSCLTMYKDPIVWNDKRQLLGEVIKVYMADSTIKEAIVLGQAMSVELTKDNTHYNQISSRDMHSYFINGVLRRNDAISNVRAIYFPIDDKDGSYVGLNYMETDTMKMYLSENKKLNYIWTPKVQGTMYPMTQISIDKSKLQNFAWFDEIRPKNKNDIMIWKEKNSKKKISKIKRHAAPLQKLDINNGITTTYKSKIK